MAFGQKIGRKPANAPAGWTPNTNAGVTAFGGLNVASLGLRDGQPLYMGEGVALDPDASPPLPGYIRLYAVTGPLQSLDVMTVGEFRPLSDPYGTGWDPVERDLQTDVQVFRGARLYGQSGPILLDMFGTGSDIEAEWRALERMCRLPHGAKPPVLRVAGPVFHPDLRWVITGLEPGGDEDDVIRENNRLVRVAATLTLSQYVEVDLADDAAGAVRARRSRSVPRSVRAREGDTLRTIAKRELGSERRWKEVRDAPGNKGLRDPGRKIRKGTQVWLP